MSLSNNPTATLRVNPPRWVHVRFPQGAMFGEPGNRDKQLRVLRATLEAFEEFAMPGQHVSLPERWEAPPVMWRGAPLTEGSYNG
jgi:hypothetical protein